MKRVDVDAIQDIIERLEEIEQELDNILKDTDYEDHYDVYQKYGLSQLLGNGNRFDSSLVSLIENANEEFE